MMILSIVIKVFLMTVEMIQDDVIKEQQEHAHKMERWMRRLMGMTMTVMVEDADDFMEI